MKQSKAFISTLRENPKDADIVSHQLLSRGNFIRKHAAGIYSYLPLLVRSYHKLCRILREELDGIEWQEVVMPYAIPADLWKETGRWDLFEGLMIKFKDRRDGDYCLGPTHEEVVTDLVRSQVTSYKQLPVTLYQIAPKFRDEFRPRFGLMRGREFVMMDGYSFHDSKVDLDTHYEVVDKAYRRIFDRTGLKYVRVEADTGAIGGSGSHEFQVLAETGEDAILSCTNCEYAANVEKAETPSPEIQAKRQMRDWGKANADGFSEVATPNQKTIEEVSSFLDVPPHRNIKTLVYRYNTAKAPGVFKSVVIYLGGHRQLNTVKLAAQLAVLGNSPMEISPLPEPEVEQLFGCAVGYLGPIKGPAQVLTLFDKEIFGAHSVVCGANKAGFHFSKVEPTRDFTVNPKMVVDVATAEKGDACPRCEKGVYAEHRGIEVGHIFKLGNKYSKAMKAQFLDDKKGTQIMEMGCYGIGVTRILAACIEQNHDADGMIWPESLAPFAVHLISLQPADTEVAALADGLYAEYRRRGIEVLYDERDMSPGVKFKDSELIGLPRRVVVGKKGVEQGEVEFAKRRDKTKVFLKFDRSGADFVLKLAEETLKL